MKLYSVDKEIDMEYIIACLQGHNGSGTIYGMYSYLYGGTNTTGKCIWGKS